MLSQSIDLFTGQTKNYLICINDNFFLGYWVKTKNYITVSLSFLYVNIVKKNPGREKTHTHIYINL